MWDLVGNPEDRFSHNKAHLKVGFVRAFNHMCVSMVILLISTSSLSVGPGMFLFWLPIATFILTFVQESDFRTAGNNRQCMLCCDRLWIIIIDKYRVWDYIDISHTIQLFRAKGGCIISGVNSKGFEALVILFGIWIYPSKQVYSPLANNPMYNHTFIYTTK